MSMKTSIMRTRPLLQAALDARWTQSRSTFSIPFPRIVQQHIHQAAQSTQFHQTPPEITPKDSLGQYTSPLSSQQTTNPVSTSRDLSPNPHSLADTTSSLPTPSEAPTSKPLIISKSLQTLLPNLHAQSPHYITTHIHRFPYLVTTGDLVRLPFHMPSVSVGDILRLNRASLLGSRDYTLKAGLTGLPPNARRSEDEATKLGSWGSGEDPYLDERLFVCRARVVGVDHTPMMIKEKTKRRQRRVKRVKSKFRYTVLRVMEVRVKALEELVREEGPVILE